MRRVDALTGFVACATLLVSCSSSPVRRTVADPTTSTVISSIAARDALEFREVLGAVPYKPRPGDPPNTSCNNGSMVTPRDRRTPTQRIVLPDRNRTVCYVLGPTILTGRAVDRAQARFDSVAGAWDVNLHFADDDFLAKIARPDVGREIAIVFDAVVQSAPTINQGITGRDVTVSGQFDEATARAIARRLS